MSPRIYLAASSDELGRARWAMDRVRDHGWQVALDWVTHIEQIGVANPTDAPRSKRADWAHAALSAIEGADALWLLAPEAGHARGAFVELGFAVAQQTPIVVSGARRACSIFTALGQEVATDVEALAMLRGWWP